MPGKPKAVKWSRNQAGIFAVLAALAAGSMRSKYFEIFRQCESPRKKELKNLVLMAEVKEDDATAAAELEQVLDDLSQDAEYHSKNGQVEQVCALCHKALSLVRRMLDVTPTLPLFCVWDLHSQVEFTISTFMVEYEDHRPLFRLHKEVQKIDREVGLRAFEQNCWSWAKRCFERLDWPPAAEGGALADIRQRISNDWEQLLQHRLKRPRTLEDAMRIMRWVDEFQNNEFVQGQIVELRWAEFFDYVVSQNPMLLGEVSAWCFNHAQYCLMAQVETVIAQRDRLT